MAPSREIIAIELRGEGPESSLELAGTHLLWLEHQVEQGGALPRRLFEEPSLSLQARVKRCPGKGGGNSDLHLVKTAPAHEFSDTREALLILAIEAEHEAAIHA